jgi:phosphoenolpyruvate phosphomutase
MTIVNAITPGERLQALKKCIARQGFARILETHSGLSGIIAENVRVEKAGRIIEYDGLWESSLTDSASKGMPDASIVGFDSRTQTVDQILNVTTKPILVDGDTGGEPAQFEYLVKHLERLGVSAVIIEDKVYPKRNSLDASACQDLEDPRVFAGKIAAGNAVKVTEEFMIVARLESLIAGAGLEDALSRAECYIRAGAEVIMIHSKSRDPGEILAFAEAYDPLCKRLGRRPALVCVPTTYNTISDLELVARGFNVIIHANHLLRAAYRAMHQVALTILESGRSHEADPICATVREIFACVGHDRITEGDRERALALRHPGGHGSTGGKPGLGRLEPVRRPARKSGAPARLSPTSNGPLRGTR